MASQKFTPKLPGKLNRNHIIGIVFALCLISACAAQKDIEQMAMDLYAQQEYDRRLPPSPFVSDGCSCWLDYTWVECCVVHDLAYWMGGSRQERMAADLALKACVRDKGHPLMARVIFYGVRIGGTWWLPTPFRWGFGWPYPTSGPPGQNY